VAAKRASVAGNFLRVFPKTPSFAQGDRFFGPSLPIGLDTLVARRFREGFGGRFSCLGGVVTFLGEAPLPAANEVAFGRTTTDGVQRSQQCPRCEAVLLAVANHEPRVTRPVRERQFEPLTGEALLFGVGAARFGRGLEGLFDGCRYRRRVPAEDRRVELVVRFDGKCQAGAERAEVVLRGQEQCAAGIGLIAVGRLVAAACVVATDCPHASRCRGEAHRAARALNGRAVAFAEMRYREDRHSLLGGQLGERREHLADDRVEVRIARPDVGVHGVDDDQPAIGQPVEGRFELAKVVPQVGDRR
jgi:hypothetical protein